MHFSAELNPSQQEFNDIKIGEDVSITMPAWHWIELISELHTIHKCHNETPSALFQTLAGLVFQEMTPEAYRKSLHAQYEEVKERVFNPFSASFPAPDQFDEKEDDE